MPLMILLLVLAALTIVLGTVVWGWANGTLGETQQERMDHQFESIVRRFAD